MSDPFEIESASGGGGDFIPKDKYQAWGEAGTVLLAKIREIKPKGTMLPGFSNPCDPVTVDLLVLADPPVVFRHEEMTNAGMTGKLRTRTVKRDGQDVTEPRVPGQLVAGHFHRYKDKFGTMRTGINPATDAEVQQLRALAGEHGDLFEYYDGLQLRRAAQAATNGSASNGNGQPVPAPAASGDAKLPF